MSDKGKRAAGLYYEEHGSGEDVIVWLHGYACSTEQWSRIVPDFESYRSIVFDMPGHGESVDFDCDGMLNSFADPMVAALDELGVDKFTLVGYSAGGSIGVRIALDNPDRVTRVIGVVPWYSAGGDPNDPTLSAFAEEWQNEQVVRETIEGMAVVQPPYYGQLLEDELKVPEKTWKGWFMTGGKVSQADELPNLRIPVTYILGIEDVVVDVHKAIEDVRLIPNGRAVALAGVGHLCAWEVPEIIVRELHEALESESAKAPA